VTPNLSAPRELARQRCLHHAAREAVARCPECQHFFCRECVTEHDDRVICAACLKKLRLGIGARKHTFAAVRRVAAAALAFLAAWFFFFMIGESLLRLPDAFHESTLWQAGWLDQP
jgi:hypothetical protein